MAWRFTSRVGASTARAAAILVERGRKALGELVGLTAVAVAAIVALAALPEQVAELAEGPRGARGPGMGYGVAAANDDDGPRGERGAGQPARVG